MIEALLSVASKLLNIVGVFEKEKKRRREKIADYFEGISSCISDIVEVRRSEDAARKGTMTACTELEVYADRFLKIVKGVIPKKEAEELAKDLKYACFYRGILTELALDEPNQLERALNKLEQAAGQFKGMGSVKNLSHF